MTLGSVKFGLMFICSIWLFPSFLQRYDPIEEQFDDLVSKFTRHSQGDTDSANFYSLKILRLAQELRDSVLIMRAYNMCAYTHRRSGNYDSSLSYYHKALDLARVLNSPRLAQIYNSLGNLYQDYHEYDLALEYFFKSLNSRDPFDTVGIGLVNNNIGLVYRKIGNCDLAIKHFSTALQSKMVAPLLNIGLCYFDLGKYDSAIATYSSVIESIKMNTTNDDERLTLVETFIGSGFSYLEKGDYKNSEKSFCQAKQLMNEHDILKLIVYHQGMSLVKIRQDSIDPAMAELKKAENLSLKVGSKSRLAQTYSQISEVYEKTGNGVLAYFYLKKSDSLEKEIDLDNRLRKISELRMKENDRSKQLIIQNQNRQIETQRYYLIFFIVSFGLVCVIVSVVYRNSRFRKKANKQLQDTLEELRTTQDQLVAQEKMAALGQLVSGIAHEINTPLGAIQGLLPPISDHFSYVVSQLHEGVKDIPEDKLQVVLGLAQKYTGEGTTVSILARRDHKKRLVTLLSEQDLPQPRDLADKLLDIGIKGEGEDLASLLSLPDPVKVIDLLHSIVMHERGTAQMEVVVQKIAKMVSALQTYSQPHRSGDMDTLIDLRENIDQSLVLLVNEFKRGIRLIKHYPKTLSMIKANPDSLGQVWTNVLMNAIQAVEGKGTITVSIEELPGSIQVKIMDDGYGIPGEAKDRIFEAFYTTKKRGYGTGLGLNIARNIIHQHGGEINVSSLVKPTLFVLMIPK